MNRKFFFCFVSSFWIVDNKDNFNGNQCCLLPFSRKMKMIRQTNETEIILLFNAADLRWPSTSLFSTVLLTRKVPRKGEGKEIKNLSPAAYVRVCAWRRSNFL